PVPPGSGRGPPQLDPFPQKLRPARPKPSLAPPGRGPVRQGPGLVPPGLGRGPPQLDLVPPKPHPAPPEPGIARARLGFFATKIIWLSLHRSILYARFRDLSAEPLALLLILLLKRSVGKIPRGQPLLQCLHAPRLSTDSRIQFFYISGVLVHRFDLRVRI